MAVPGLPPVTTPVPVMVAIDVGLLVHVPPDGVAESGVVLPTQTVKVPKIAGIGSTVRITVAVHPASV